MAVLRKARRAVHAEARTGLDLLMLAINGRQAQSVRGFEKIIKMIDDMVELLKKEQIDDDNRKEYCGVEFDTADDKKKGLERAVSDLDTEIASIEGHIATLTDEIEALGAGIKALDKAVAEATEQREEENAAFKELMASATAAKELLKFAKNRLNKFYNPKLYVAPPKRELSRGDRVFENYGGTVTTPAPSGIAGTGITALVQV